MKAVVVGASSGLGRCIALDLAKQGDEVALLARRKDRLDDAVKEAGSKTVAIQCDVTDPSSCSSSIEEAARALGGIDALVYSTGIGPVSPITDIDADTWQRCFATNVTGAALTTAAAIPFLAESQSGGVAAYLSSVSTSETAPWPGLAAYLTSKAALNKLVECWRAEHPKIGFTRVTVGDCSGGEGDGATEFNREWDPEVAGAFYPIWFEKGLIAGTMIDIADLVAAVNGVLRLGASASVPSIVVAPRRNS